MVRYQGTDSKEEQFFYHPGSEGQRKGAAAETQAELWPWERTLRIGAGALIWREGAAAQPVRERELEE